MSLKSNEKIQDIDPIKPASNKKCSSDTYADFDTGDNFPTDGYVEDN